MNTGLGSIQSVELSPDGGRLLVVADGSGRQQPWLVSVDGSAEPRLLPVDGVVQRCAWHPSGRRFVVQVDLDGRENHRLGEVDLDHAGGDVEWVAAQAGVRNELGAPHTRASRPYSPDGRYLAFASNRRDPECFDIVLRELATGTERTVLTAGDGVPADRYFVVGFGWDSRRLLVQRIHQNTEHDLYIADLACGGVVLCTPHEGPSKCFGVVERPEGVYACVTYDGNFTGLALLSPAGRARWIDTPEHDVELATVSADGTRLVWAINEDGYTTLRHCEIRDGVPQPDAARVVAGLPRGAYVFEGGLDGRCLHLSPDGGKLFVLGGPPGRSAALWCADLEQGTARRVLDADSVTRLAGPGVTGVAPEVVRFTSADGTVVPALLYRPSIGGPLPVVVAIHGGPEDQAMPVSDPLIDGLTGSGFAVLATNIRGSSGYGVRYQRLIYRDWGGGDLADLRAAAEYLRAQPWVDANRLAVFGASYGGFAALSCLTRLPEYWWAGVSECGPCDLVQDLRDFPPTWRRRARDWIGDINDPEDLRRLVEASPLTHVDRVRAPVLLIHGANDTNVRVTSSDLFHKRLTELGKPVRFERIDGAGHAINQQVDVTSLIRDWLIDNL